VGLAGRIRRPQGRKGEVFAEILTDFPKNSPSAVALAVGEPACSLPREVELINHWLHRRRGAALCRVDSISAAETLAGLIVAIPLAERAPLARTRSMLPT